jgi:hypothetical protein
VQNSNPYVPINTPAIGDLFDMFNFAVTPDRLGDSPLP